MTTTVFSAGMLRLPYAICYRLGVCRAARDFLIAKVFHRSFEVLACDVQLVRY